MNRHSDDSDNVMGLIKAMMSATNKYVTDTGIDDDLVLRALILMFARAAAYTNLMTDVSREEILDLANQCIDIEAETLRGLMNVSET